MEEAFPVRSACQELRKVVMTARTYGGAVKRRESTSLNFKVATTVGKKFVTVPAATNPKSMTIKM